MAFEPNAGRTDPRVAFIARGDGYTLWLTRRGSVIRVSDARGRSQLLRTELVGGRREAIGGVGEPAGVVNSFHGRDRKAWRTGIPAFSRVRQPGVYPGIDLDYHGGRGALEYDFRVEAGANPGAIALRFPGAKPSVADNGDLVVGGLRQKRPVAYQGNARVHAAFAIRGDTVRFRLGSYDRSRALVIDPQIAWSSVFGGASWDDPNGIAVGDDGSTYITGFTQSTDFPTRNEYADKKVADDVDQDMFVTKIDPSGRHFAYATYIGGTGADNGQGITVDAQGRAYVVGSTDATDFPATEGDTTVNGRDAVALRLSASGSALEWSTVVGGSGTENGNAIAIDASGNAYVTGQTFSNNFPVSVAPTAAAQATRAQVSAGDGGSDAFLAKLSWDEVGSTLSTAYATYFGGGNQTGDEAADRGNAIALDSAGHVFITGTTRSPSMPTTTGAYQTTDPNASTGLGGQDAFVAEFDTTASGSASRLYSTYIGGAGATYDYSNGIGVANDGTVYIAGTTRADNLPTDPQPHASANPDPTEDQGFIGRLDLPASFHVFYFGGTDGLIGTQVSGMAFRQNGESVYVTGSTDTTNFPRTNALQAAPNSPEQNAFVLKYSLSAIPSIVYSTTLGGTSPFGDAGHAIAVDAEGSAFVTGMSGADYPEVNPLEETMSTGWYEGFATRIDTKLPKITSGPAEGSYISDPNPMFGISSDGETGYHNLGCSSVTAGVLDNTALAACMPPTRSYSGLADGQQVFELRLNDAVEDRSAPVHRTFTVDTVPPAAFELGSPGDGATASTKPTFTWAQPADATSGIDHYDLTVGTTTQRVEPGACAAGSCSATLANSVANGSYSWKVRAFDKAGNVRESATRQFTAADPPVAQLVVSPNPALVGRPVSFDASGSADATHTIAKYEWDLDGDGSFETDTGATGTTSRSYGAPQTITVTVQVTDSLGIKATAAQQLRITSTSGPAQFGVTINNGAQYTRTPNVTVSASFPGTITQMLFSNDGGFLAPTTFPPQKETKWKLDSSGPERLPKTIYVRFLTSGIVSETYQDDIILDETPPKVDSASLLPSPGAAAARIAKARSYTVKVKATDSNSGVDKVQVTANKRKPGKLLSYKRKLKLKSPAKPKFIRARDRAGNFSRWKKLR